MPCHSEALRLLFTGDNGGSSLCHLHQNSQLEEGIQAGNDLPESSKTQSCPAHCQTEKCDSSLLTTCFHCCSVSSPALGTEPVNVRLASSSSVMETHFMNSWSTVFVQEVYNSSAVEPAEHW